MELNIKGRTAFVLSASLLFLAFPPFHFLLPSFVALIPVTAWVIERDNSKAGRIQSCWGGMIFGVLYWGLILHWIPITLWETSVWSVPAYVTLVLILALPKAIFAWILHFLVHEARISIPLALALSWTGLDWLLGNLPGVFSFPWLELGTSLTGYPKIVGSAELIGARGITFWIALINGLLLELIILLRYRFDSYRLAVKAITIILLFALPVAWGLIRSESLTVLPVGEVAVIQPNVTGKTDMNNTDIAEATFLALEKLKVNQMGSASDLTVLPEATFWNRIESNPMIQERLVETFSNWSSPILFGGIGVTEHSPGSIDYNSAFLLDSKGVLTDFRYDKHYLVPWFETMPLSTFQWRTKDRNFSEYGKGEDLVIGEFADDMKFGVLICYESIFPKHSRLLRKEGADILVNITNDSWLQSGWNGVPYRTLAFWQHPAHLIMRAIENRVGIVRSANTGFSFFVDPLGQTYGRLESSQAMVDSRLVYTTPELTLYARLGDFVGLGSFLGLIFFALNIRFRLQGA
ncbi:MAG: apolipoprotein N-acyltransferase [Gemmatimonadetes bacterium]|nr:apolipoprotein N-acyltransferase [Gemmatimonadota bacterium]